jgi:hypothetical protein
MGSTAFFPRYARPERTDAPRRRLSLQSHDFADFPPRWCDVYRPRVRASVAAFFTSSRPREDRARAAHVAPTGDRAWHAHRRVVSSNPLPLVLCASRKRTSLTVFHRHPPQPYKFSAEQRVKEEEEKVVRVCGGMWVRVPFPGAVFPGGVRDATRTPSAPPAGTTPPRVRQTEPLWLFRLVFQIPTLRSRGRPRLVASRIPSSPPVSPRS